MAARFGAAANEDETVERLEGARAWALLKGTRTNGQLAIGRLALPAGSATSVRTDTGQDTILLPLRGSVMVRVGEHRRELGPGGVAFLPRGVAHAYRATTEADALVLRSRSPRGPSTVVEPVPYLAGMDEHETLEWLHGSVVRVLLDTHRTGGGLSMGRSTFHAGSGSPIYVHGNEDEVVVMLRGSAIYWVGEHRHEVSAGDVVVVPRGVSTAHRMTTEAEILVVTTPGGLEELFRAACRDVRDPRPEGWVISFDTMRRAAESAGQSVIAGAYQAY